MNLQKYIERQKEFSEKTFGKGTRSKGVVAHIRKELKEIEEDPTDLYEWVDVIILAMDGAWRAGYSPNEVSDALLKKAEINRNRDWPTPTSEDVPVEHIK